MIRSAPRWPGGLRLWRVSTKEKDLGDKEPYDPAVAESQSRAHAGHFAQLLGEVVRQQREHKGNVIVAPFDTELFGHWWYEGPDFLRHLYAALPYQTGVHPVTAGQPFDAHEPKTTLRLARGSWGKDGDWSMWLGPLTAWTWPVIWGIEETFWDLAPRAMQRPELHPMLAQAAREMLLLQSSDWQFIITTGEVEDYAVRRFNGYAEDARRLLASLGSALDGEDPAEGNRLAGELQQRDDVFREILPSIEVALDETLSPAMA